MAEENKKILIIVYYWPPSGGSGVQRWVKLAKYLVEQGVKVHVLTVDEKYASYLQTDPSLVDDVHPDINVVKTRSREIINVFASLFGKKKVPTAGFYNLDKKSIIHKLGLIIRSNFFIPDPRRGWNYFAYRKACEIIRKENITKIITSTPPHSSQLIGLKLKKKFGLEWVADLRDPWTDIFYYKLLKHSYISKRIDRHYELKVLKNADYITTVSQKLKQIFVSKDKHIDPNKVSIIPNGYDESDFEHVEEYLHGDEFIIGYTGTMSDQYEPFVFLKAFRNFIEKSSGRAKLEITGTISPTIIQYAEKLGILDCISIHAPVPHKEIPGLLGSKSALLLVIPRVENAGLILTGKLFEYLASGRPVILVGPIDGDAAKILTECNAGSAFDWEAEEYITEYLLKLHELHGKGLLVNNKSEQLNKYSRKTQAAEINSILFH